MIEQVYNRYYDTAGNYHWIGVHSGEHIVRKGEKMTKDEAIFELGYAKDFQTPKRKEAIDMAIEALSAETKKTVYIPDTKAIPTARSCVDLAEKVTATFYDEEHEEWTQRTVTIADVLDSVCDTYTILPSAERVGHWIQISPAKIYECSECGQNVMTDDIEYYKYCHGCGARMVSE